MSDELNQEAPTSWEAPAEAEAPAVVEVVSTPAEPEPVVVPEPEPEPVVEVVATPEPAAEVETPAAEVAKSKKSTAAASYQDGEVVVLSKLVLSSKERNSRSVALVQEQLISKGYTDADMDKRGWYKENTQKALLEFCGSEGINEATLKKLFANTKVAIAY
jgi:outer membrane biosynthesis protein TonB